MAKIPIKDLTWGLNLKEPSTLKDNEFVSIKNMSYNADGRLQSRRGTSEFSIPIGTWKPITSTFYFKDRNNNLRVLIATSGEQMFRYNDGTDSWDEIKNGLTEFEADGVTRTKWSFAVLREKIYMWNGLDDYAEYDPLTDTYTELPTQPKVRYIAYLADAIRATGADATPWTLYVTNSVGATAADGRTINANELLVWGAESGGINALEELQSAVLAYKDKKIFYISGDLTSAQPFDAENGGYGHRAIKKVGNGLIHFNDRGFNTLSAKWGSISANAVQDEPLSDNIRELTSKVPFNQYKSTIWSYILPLTNYYGSFDTSGDDIADTTVVYSSLTKGWTQHIYPWHFDLGEYEDSDWVMHYLMASATSDQMFEYEVGFNDLWAEIDCELETKPYDLGDANDLKTVYNVDISGLKSEWDDVQIELLSEWEVISWGVVTDDYINVNKTINSLGTNPIWTTGLAGGEIGQQTIDLYRYFIRLPLYNMGQDISIRMTSSSKWLVWTFDTATLYVDAESDDLVYEQNLG